MKKPANNSDAKLFTDCRTTDLQYQAVEREISKTYNVEEIIAFFWLEFADSRGIKETNRKVGAPGDVDASGWMREDAKIDAQTSMTDVNRKRAGIAEGPQTRGNTVILDCTSERSIQFREASSNTVSLLDVFLTIAAGLLIGFILFGAFLF